MLYSLYFHVPFCIKKCGYCHFYVIPNHERFHQLYMRSLKQEWDIRSSLLPKDGQLVSIYFGGGTPSLLGPKNLEMILSWINPSDDVEITLEANPDTPIFAYPGINRISLGVQSFDDYLLKNLSRTHDAQKAEEALYAFVDAGIDNISIDLMYDLPGQSLQSWNYTLERALQLPITHLSLYNLTIEPHTSFYKNREQLQKMLPSDRTSLQMLQSAVKTFTTNDFERYEISAFSKPGAQSRHNIGYWKGRPFLGFGPSAFSYWEGARFRNCANLNRYAKQLNQAELPMDFHEKLSPEERLKEKLAIQLRLMEGMEAWPCQFKKIYTMLCERGFLDPETLTLSEQGILFHDTVAEIIMNE